jgi:predicted XRE-type DNA-binding protein
LLLSKVQLALFAFGSCSHYVAVSAVSLVLGDLHHTEGKQGMTQAQDAVFFGGTQPRISDLMRGKVNLFSLDTLIDMAATAGMGPTVKVSMPRAAPAKRPARRVVAHA